VIGDAQFCYRPPEHLAADRSVLDHGIPYFHDDMLPPRTNVDNPQGGGVISARVTEPPKGSSGMGKGCSMSPTIGGLITGQSAGSCLIAQVEIRYSESSSPLLVVR
jgi:hypothetical protein